MEKIYTPLVSKLFTILLFINCHNSRQLPDSDHHIFNHHIVFIAIEGLITERIQAIKMPVLNQLIQEGAYTLTLQSDSATSCTQNWEMLLTGTGQPPTKRELSCDSLTIPTLFQVIRQQFSNSTIACIHQHPYFKNHLQHDSLSFSLQKNTAEATIQAAMKTTFEQKPFLAFIQISPFQPIFTTNAVHYADTLIGEIVRTLSATDILDKTFIVVAGLPDETTNSTHKQVRLPLIISGDRIRDGLEIKRSVTIQDIAPTLLQLLYANIPDCWTGKPLVTLQY